MATATVTMATLVASVLPLASAGAQEAPQGSATSTVSGARTVPLTAAQRGQMLKSAAGTSAATAEALRLGGKEKLVPRDVIKDADGTRAHPLRAHLRRTPRPRRRPRGPQRGEAPAREQGVGAARSRCPRRRRRSRGADGTAAALRRRQGPGHRKARRRQGRPAWSSGRRPAQPTLAWETVVTGVQEDGTPSRLHVITDAATGEQLSSYEDDPDSAPAHGQYSGRVPLGTTQSGSTYSADRRRRAAATRRTTSTTAPAAPARSSPTTTTSGATARRPTARPRRSTRPTAPRRPGTSTRTPSAATASRNDGVGAYSPGPLRQQLRQRRSGTTAASA